MAQPSTVLKLLDEIKVAPPPGSVATTAIPFTFFDVNWFLCCPVQRILFYEFPYSAHHIKQSILPNLNTSLSHTLRHFFPYAANIICPPPPQPPYILYNDGDAISVIVAESDADFGHLVSNHARDIKQLRSLVPKLQSPRFTSDTTGVFPIASVQFTIFPNSGISIGFTYCHAAADGRSFIHFIKSWASIYRFGALQNLLLPYTNKDVIKDPNGLSSIFWRELWSAGHVDSPESALPQDNFLVSFVMTRAQIKKLKDLVTENAQNDAGSSEALHVSTYVVASAFMWVYLNKLQESDKSRDQLKDDLVYHFLFIADCRERFRESRIPANFFGNCLASLWVTVKRSELMGTNGFINGAKLIGRKINEAKKEPLKAAEKWLSGVKEILMSGRTVTVAGSPSLRVYETDFGWGKPVKSEMVHIGNFGAFSLAESRDEEGGVEIGLVIAREKLSLFNSIFEQGLNNL